MTPRRHEVIEVRGDRRIRALYVDGKLERIVSEPLPPSPPPPPIPAAATRASAPKAPEAAPPVPTAAAPAEDAVEASAPATPTETIADAPRPAPPVAASPRVRPVFEILSVEPVETPAPAVVRVPVQGREPAEPAPAPAPLAEEAPAPPEPRAAAMESAAEPTAEPAVEPAESASADAARSLFGKLRLPRRRADDAMPAPEPAEATDEAKAAPLGLGKLRLPRRASRDETPKEPVEAKPTKSLVERLPKLPSIKLPKRVAKPPPRDPDLKEAIPPAPRATLADRLKQRLSRETPTAATPAETPTAATPAETPVEVAPPEPVAAEAPSEPVVPEPRAPFAPSPELLATVGDRVDAVIARAVERRVEVDGPESVAETVEAEATTSVAVERVAPIPEPSFAPIEPAPWEDRLEAVLAARGSTKR